MRKPAEFQLIFSGKTGAFQKEAQQWTEVHMPPIVDFPAMEAFSGTFRMLVYSAYKKPCNKRLKNACKKDETLGNFPTFIIEL